MALLKKFAIPDGILLIRELSEPANMPADMISGALTDPDFKNITSPKRQQEWLSIRALLLEAGCTPEQLSYRATGEPRIHHPDYQWISISHSDRLVGILLHKKHPVGIDIENAHRNFKRVADKYLSPEEKSLAGSFADGYGLFWCIKEAVYKAARTPGIHFAEQIHIERDAENRLTVGLSVVNKPAFGLHYFRMDEQLIAYVIANHHEQKTF